MPLLDIGHTGFPTGYSGGCIPSSALQVSGHVPRLIFVVRHLIHMCSLSCSHA